MITQTGQLVRIDGATAWVRLGGQAGCPACDAGRGCGAGLFGRLLRRRPVELALENRIGARVGQRVRVGLPESVYLSLVWRIYGIPLLAGLAGAVLCHQILGQALSPGFVLDAGTALGGVALAAFFGYAVRRRPAGLLDESPVKLLDAEPGPTACAEPTGRSA